MVRRSILSLDMGSSSCKAVLFSDEGVELASGTGQYPLYYSEGQVYVEQEPDEIWEGVCTSIRGALKEKPADTEISAISLCSQVSSHFLIDGNNEPLTRIITWSDSRAIGQAEQMKAAFSQDQLIQYLGADLPSGAWWPIPKLKWWSENHLELLANARYIVQPKEWIIWKLTGEWMSDLSSLRGLVHQSTKQPANILLDWAGAPQSLIPPIGEPFQGCGRLLPASASLTGLKEHLPVILGWNDLHSAILGACDWKSKESSFDITGTSEQIGQCIHEDQITAMSQNGIIRMPFINRYQTVYGVTSSGGQALKWYAEQIDQYQSEQHNHSVSYESLSSQMSLSSAGASGLIFLPYLNGERSPWWNPDARGVFFGLNFSHMRPHLTRAVMEGVGYALRSILERFPVAPKRMITAGGASKSDAWNQIKANILDLPVFRTQTTEAGCLGAAILAAFALGWYPSLEEARARMVSVENEYVPDASTRSIYDESYGNFIELYSSLIPLFKKTAVERSKGGTGKKEA